MINKMPAYASFGNPYALSPVELMAVPALISSYAKLQRAFNLNPTQRGPSALREFIDAMARHQQIKKRSLEQQLKGLISVQLLMKDDAHFITEFIEDNDNDHQPESADIDLALFLKQVIDQALRKIIFRQKKRR